MPPKQAKEKHTNSTTPRPSVAYTNTHQNQRGSRHHQEPSNEARSCTSQAATVSSNTRNHARKRTKLHQGSQRATRASYYVTIPNVSSHSETSHVGSIPDESDQQKSAASPKTAKPKHLGNSTKPPKIRTLRTTAHNVPAFVHQRRFQGDFNCSVNCRNELFNAEDLSRGGVE